MTKNRNDVEIKEKFKQALTSTVIMEEDDNVTNQWTVLRAMDE